MTDLDWPSLDMWMQARGHSVTPELAAAVANLGLRRYWESVRLLLILQCLKHAGDAPAIGARELRMATALIQRQPLRRGADVEADPLDDLGDVLIRVFAIRFGDSRTEHRLDAFCNRLRWEEREPEVPGWIYSWSGGLPDVNSLTPQLIQLLTAVTESPTLGARECGRRVERFWRDIDKLESIATFCDAVRRTVLTGGPHAVSHVVQALRTSLGKNASLAKARLLVVNGCKGLSRAARHDRLIALRSLSVNPICVGRYTAKLSEAAFAPDARSPLETTSLIVPTAIGPRYEMQFSVEKRRLADSSLAPLSDESAKYTGAHLRLHADVWALKDYLSRKGVTAIPAAGVARLSTARLADRAAFVSGIAAACSALRATGKTPLVLVSPGPLSGLLSNYQYVGFGIRLRLLFPNSGGTCRAACTEKRPGDVCVYSETLDYMYGDRLRSPRRAAF